MKTWLFLVVVAIAAPAVAQVNEIFVTGETLDYDLSWLGIPGGSARMTVGPVPNDAAHFRMTSIARSNPSFSLIARVRDEIESIVNRSDFSTVRYDKHLDERGKIKDDTTFVDEKEGVATRVRPQKTNEHLAVPKPVFDPLSLVYHLRALDLEPGKTQTFTVYGDGKVYTLNANIIRRETLHTPAGTFPTVVVEPKMIAGGLFREQGSLTIWYSDDARHIPVRIRSDVKVGAIVATLRGMQAGVASPDPIVTR